jgi:hypothetical protein
MATNTFKIDDRVSFINILDNSTETGIVVSVLNSDCIVLFDKPDMLGNKAGIIFNDLMQKVV